MYLCYEGDMTILVLILKRVFFGSFAQIDDERWKGFKWVNTVGPRLKTFALKSGVELSAEVHM